MVQIRLPHIQRLRDRRGVVRHYYRRPGLPRVTLPGAPGSAEFMEAYQAAAEAARQPQTVRFQPGSIGALIGAWYASPAWAQLQPQTQRVYRLLLDKFRETYGAGTVANLKPAHLVKILDKYADRPSQAARLLKLLRAVYRFALARGLAASDPTVGIRLAPRKSAGFRPWTDADIEAFEAHWPTGRRERLALYLLLFTGQRRSDVVRMGRQHVRGGILTVVQQKTGAQLEIPIHPTLAAELELQPKTQLTFLMTAQGRPFSGPGFSNWFAESAAKAGLPAHSSPHGLRKAASRWLAEAGATAFEIAAITGHASLKEVERYTKSASQKRLAATAMARIGNKP
jgi:integrase